MPEWKPIVGLSFEPDAFDVYCRQLSWTNWRPSFVALHNTAVPSLAQRPHGFTRQHIDNLVGYYRDKCKWRAGPHLFIDDHRIWVFTPLTTPGRHSPSWNNLAIGVEMLGDYEKEAFDSGRGAGVRDNAVAAIATLCGTLGLAPSTLKLHKEDKATTHDCPGAKVSKKAFVAAVERRLSERYGADSDPHDPHPD